MSSHRTVLHLPVTFVLPTGCDPAAFAKFLADEAAMGIEKIGLADGDVLAAETSHDPVLDAYPAPAAACNVCADPGRPVDDGTGHPYALCDSDDEGHARVREGIAKNLARAALYGDSDGEQD